MPSKLPTLFLIIISFLVAGCSVSIRNEITATAAPIIITATLPPTPSPRPSETPLPPPPSLTVVPVRGTTSTQLNVRAEPSTTSNVLGVVPANTEVQIVGADPGGNWWQIVYELGVDGKGWVTAQYVETVTKPEVPVIGGDGTNPISGNSAIVIQQLNIRSGPGTNYNSLGILNVNDVVKLTGKNRDGTWLQVQFAAGPGGRGWVNSGFVKADDTENLPIVSESGEVIGTGTPVDTPHPSTPTLVPAPQDNDSSTNPIASVIFNRGGTTSLIYSGDVSAPDGDTEDWIAFTPYGDVVYAGIQCIGSDSLRVEFSGVKEMLTCNRPNLTITVPAGMQILAHIIATSNSGQLQYTKYTITINASP